MTSELIHLFVVFLWQSLDGFALALAGDGRFLYISETVSIYLGLSQVGGGGGGGSTAMSLINTEWGLYQQWTRSDIDDDCVVVGGWTNRRHCGSNKSYRRVIAVYSDSVTINMQRM